MSLTSADVSKIEVGVDKSARKARKDQIFIERVGKATLTSRGRVRDLDRLLWVVFKVGGGSEIRVAFSDDGGLLFRGARLGFP